MTVTILIGDVRAKLAELPDDSVHCAVTSPPYFGLRCYGVDGQIGLEATPEEHIKALVDVFREVRRVLRKDGVLWLNYGDAYAGGGRGGNADESPYRKQATNSGSLVAPTPLAATGAKAKDLLMMPARVALALQADGWWLRSMMPWVKRSAMPESVTDRPATAIEYVFLLTKSGDATFWQHRDGGAVNVQPEPDYRWVNNLTGAERYEPREGKEWRRINLWRGRDYFFDMEAVRSAALPASTKRMAAGYLGNDPARDAENNYGDGFQRGKGYERSSRNFRNSDLFYASLAPPHGLIYADDPLALDVNPAGFSDAHFATFPPKLIEPLIKAGTSEKGVCADCGAPWVREVGEGAEPKDSFRNAAGYRDHANEPGYQGRQDRAKGKTGGPTVGWSPSCACKAAVVPATVLDPFGGAGTSGLVADRLGRDAILIELNPEYAAMARRRIDQDAATRGTGPAEVMAGDDLPLFGGART